MYCNNTPDTITIRPITELSSIFSFKKIDIYINEINGVKYNRFEIIWVSPCSRALNQNI